MRITIDRNLAIALVRVGFVLGMATPLVWGFFSFLNKIGL